MDTDGLQFANPIDNLTYFYDTDNKNLLLKVTDDSFNPQGFKDGTNIDNDYSYDDNGNLTKDNNKNIKTIKYNHLNLPTQIIFVNGNKILYLYNAVGQKVRKSIDEIVNNQAIFNQTDYLAGFQYHNTVLKHFPHAEGYVNTTRIRGGYMFNYVFNYTDHLGNIRLSYGVDQGNVLKIIEENHYYPFGLKHTNYNTDVRKYIKHTENDLVTLRSPISSLPTANYTDYKYKYNGKEYQDELGLNMYDYGARNYDPALGRWMNMDEKAEFYVGSTVYSYALNNPVSAIDPDGKLVIFVNGYFSRAGNIVGLAPGAPLKPYWDFFSPLAINSVRNFLGAKDAEQNYFVDGSSYVGFDQSGGDRYDNGYKYAEKNYTSIISQMAEGETIKFVGHSEGSAFAAGMMAYFIEKAEKNNKSPKVESSLHLSPDEADEYCLPDYSGTDYQLHNGNDPISPFHELMGSEYIFVGNKSSKSGAHGGTVSKKAIQNLVEAINTFLSSPNIEKLETKNGTIYYNKPIEE